MPVSLNAGSGQRPFRSTNDMQWINLDISDKHAPDIVADWNNLPQFGDNTFDFVVSHHSIEHAGCNEAAGFVREAHRTLKVGGSLLVFVPDLRALAQRWLTGQLDTQIYLTNLYGPFDGTEASRHRWGFDNEHMKQFLSGNAPWRTVRLFDWRPISGGDFAQDWHILAMEATK